MVNIEFEKKKQVQFCDCKIQNTMLTHLKVFIFNSQMLVFIGSK